MTAGEHALRLTGAGVPVILTVPVATAGLPAITAARHRSALSQVVFDPAGARLSGEDDLHRVGVALPHREVRVLGLGLPWLVSFTVLSMAAGLLLRSRLRVEI